MYNVQDQCWELHAAILLSISSWKGQLSVKREEAAADLLLPRCREMDAEMGLLWTLHHHPGQLNTATAAPLGSNHTQWANYLNVAASSLQPGAWRLVPLVTIVRCCAGTQTAWLLCPIDITIHGSARTWDSNRENKHCLLSTCYCIPPLGSTRHDVIS